jgi:hypothetical protein
MTLAPLRRPRKSSISKPSTFTALHEIGHWLGLVHAPDGEKSIMVESPLQAFLGEGKYSRLWMVDKRLACLLEERLRRRLV